MDVLPSSLVTALATSAAAGKNPWLPLAFIFLLAAPDSVHAGLMAPELHAQLHTMMPVEALWTLGGIFCALAVADSLADKIGFIEKWLVPISTAWRPFAGIACATLVGVAASRAVAPDVAEEVVARAGPALLSVTSTLEVGPGSLLASASIVALFVGLSAVFTWIATVGKTGARLLLTMVPVPGLKLAHSLVDDFFAVGATVAGLMFGDSVFLGVLLALYLVVGCFTAPALTRLALIHARIGWALVRKARGRPPATEPAWVTAWRQANGFEGGASVPGWTWRAPELGWARGGHLVVAPAGVAFVSRVFFRPRAFVIAPGSLARLALSDTPTARVITPVERLESGALREVAVTLYPALEEAILPALADGARASDLARVRRDSESARLALPGYRDRGRSTRFASMEAAGSLRLQGLVTLAGAIGVGVLTGGVFVPIGLGYLVSPFKRRGVVGLLLAGYFTLCVLGSGGLGWPAAVLYASVLNAVTLRDLTRNALKARVDGYVDRRAWLPLTATSVWVPSSAVGAASDRVAEGADAQVADGGWRVIAAMLAEDPIGAA